MSLFKKLSSEIEDIIWSLYWIDIFKSSVINHFNIIKEKVIDLGENVTLSKILNFPNEAKKLEHLNKYNNIIHQLNPINVWKENWMNGFLLYVNIIGLYVNVTQLIHHLNIV